MRLLIGEAEPFARGRKRFIVGPSLTKASETTRFSTSKSKLFSALATADINTFSMIPAALFGVNFKIAIASATLFPLIKSMTRRGLRGETRNVLAVAYADVICSAICISSPQINVLFSYRQQRVRDKFLLVQIHLIYVLPYPLGCKQVHVFFRHTLR